MNQVHASSSCEDTMRSLFGRTTLAGQVGWADVKYAVGRVSPHFFDADTMRSFGSRCVGTPRWIALPELDSKPPYSERGNPVVAFVTSERDTRAYTGAQAWNGKRRYTVRIFDGRKVSTPVGFTYGQFATREKALAALREIEGISAAHRREVVRDNVRKWN